MSQHTLDCSLHAPSGAIIPVEGDAKFDSPILQSNSSRRPSTTQGCTGTLPEQTSHAPFRPPLYNEQTPNDPLRIISVSYIMRRFMTVECMNEPLRVESIIGISECRIQEGEDMFERKMDEEGWEEVDGEYENSSQESIVGESEGKKSIRSESVGRLSDASYTDTSLVYSESLFGSPYLEGSKQNQEYEKEVKMQEDR